MDNDEVAWEKWFADEPQCMAAENYFSGRKAVLRRRAVHYIVNAMQNSVSQSYDAYVPYLAVSFFDRFFSRNNLPILLRKERDNLHLLAFGCLSIAWKMTVHAFRVSKLMDDIGEYFPWGKCNAMELRILKALEWRMHGATAFIFLDFLGQSRVLSGMIRGVKLRCISRVVIQSQGDINFTRFRPSIIAASALLTVTSIFNDDQFSVVLGTVLTDSHIKPEDISACVDELSSMCITKQMMIEFWDNSMTRSRERVPQPPPTESMEAGESSSGFRRRPGKEPMIEMDIEITSQIEDVVVTGSQNENEDTSETESLVLKYEVFQWVDDEDGNAGLTADLRRRKAAESQPRCSFKSCFSMNRV